MKIRGFLVVVKGKGVEGYSGIPAPIEAGKGEEAMRVRTLDRGVRGTSAHSAHIYPLDFSHWLALGPPGDRFAQQDSLSDLGH